jgi:hypothetical protein
VSTQRYFSIFIIILKFCLFTAVQLPSFSDDKKQVRIRMRLRPIAAILPILLAPVIAHAQTDPALLRFVPNDAKALISIDWKRVRQSPVGTMIRQKWVDGSAIPGVELLNDIDRVVISSQGRNPVDAPSPAEDAPMLIAVGGHFDLARVREILSTQGAKPQMFNNVQVYRPQGTSGKEMAFVLLDAQTILIGDPRSVFASLERTAFPISAPDATSLLARAAQLDINYDAWALMTTPGVLASDRLMAMFTGGELGTEAQGFEIGFSLRSGLTVDTTVMFQSEAAAKRMSSELGRLLKLAIKDKMSEPAMLDMEKKLKIASEGSLVKIAMRMTQPELDKNAQIFAVSHKTAAAPAADVRPLVISSSAPPKPAKQVIRIEGLDEGTREIPFKQQ